MYVQIQLRQTFRDKSANICNEDTDAKINAYHVFRSKTTWRLSLVSRHCTVTVACDQMFHICYMCLHHPISISHFLFLSLSASISLCLSHFNSLNFNCKCGVPQRNLPLISVQPTIDHLNESNIFTTT